LTDYEVQEMHASFPTQFQTWQPRQTYAQKSAGLHLTPCVLNNEERGRGMTVKELVERLGTVSDIGGLTTLYDQYDIHPLTMESEAERDLLRTFLERNNVSRDQWHLDDNILWIRSS
jgi:hypothetical protein